MGRNPETAASGSYNFPLSKELRPKSVEPLARAGLIYDFGREKTFSLGNAKEIQMSVKELPIHCELSSAGESLLVDIESNDKGEVVAKLDPLNPLNLNGQTPRLFGDAFSLVAQVSNIRQEEIILHIDTDHPDVIAWGENNLPTDGQRPKGKGFVFTKTFIPQLII